MIIHYKIPGGDTRNSRDIKENKMETVAKIVGLAIVGVAAIIVVGLILSLPVMWLWNACLVAAIPGIKEIGWLQAWGIMILCGLLFKSSSSSSSN